MCSKNGKNEEFAVKRTREEKAKQKHIQIEEVQEKGEKKSGGEVYYPQNGSILFPQSAGSVNHEEIEAEDSRRPQTFHSLHHHLLRYHRLLLPLLPPKQRRRNLRALSR